MMVSNFSDDMQFLWVFGNVMQLRMGINIQPHLSKHMTGLPRGLLCNLH